MRPGRDREGRQKQLRYLFERQKGKCHVCGELAVLGSEGDDAAVRFRTGSRFGKPERIRPRVMAHKRCAQERSDQIQASQPVEESRARSRRYPTEFWSAPVNRE